MRLALFSYHPGIIAGMMHENLAFQGRRRQVEIDFRCGYRLVAEHLLDGSQVGSPFEKVGGEGMAQRMRGDGFPDVGFHGQLPDDGENHLSGEPGTAPVQEKDVFLSRPDDNA